MAHFAEKNIDLLKNVENYFQLIHPVVVPAPVFLSPCVNPAKSTR